MADPFITPLINGDILGFVHAIYTSVMGEGFYFLVLAGLFGIIYNRSRSLALCAVLWLLLGSSWLVLTVEINPIAVGLCLLGVIGILFKVFKR